jgi:hypothetical protein
MRAGVVLVLSTFAIAPLATAGNENVFSRVEGTYSSSVLGGCSLKLDRQGTFVMSCAHGALSEKAVARGRRVGIHLPGSHTLPPPVTAIPQPPAPSDKAPWPPSLEDPTPPLVAAEVDDPKRVWLTPIQWGPRLYLVLSLAAFCHAIREGHEPRTVAMGVDFLRAGDHRKPVSRKPPVECEEPPRE